MQRRDPDRSRWLRRGGGFAAAGVLALAACSAPEPQVSVSDLNWACGPARCTASFRLTAGDSADEDLLVLVRAYAGDSVANREIVGEHQERLTLRSGQARRFSVVVETERAADRVRVIPQRDR
ncbi:MAG: hypothetical protein WBO04_12350 [Steroidobacteraceae bacterium]